MAYLGKQQVSSGIVPKNGQKKSLFQPPKFPARPQNVTAPLPKKEGVQFDATTQKETQAETLPSEQEIAQRRTIEEGIQKQETTQKETQAESQEQRQLKAPPREADHHENPPWQPGKNFLTAPREDGPIENPPWLQGKHFLAAQREDGHNNGEVIRAKLTIGEPNDKYEQEADRVAAEVVQQLNSPAPISKTEEEESVQRKERMMVGELRMKPMVAQRELEAMEEEEEEIQKKPQVQRLEAIGGGEASREMERQINSARGRGEPLDAGLQQSMGQAMGADLSEVRVHTDAKADQLNQSLQAKAFTTGQDVFFRQGAYQPVSRRGQELIAHELTHVVQQNGIEVQRKEIEQGEIQTKPENKTGLPDQLKTGVESLSGIAMDDVKVHYNSSEPAKLQASAYTEGTDIYIAPGQEKHLPHEAWHVVQQKQGRVQASIQMKGINANVDFMLEKEADVMGAKANNIDTVVSRLPSNSEIEQSSQLFGQSITTAQRTVSGTPVRQFQCSCIGSQNTHIEPTIRRLGLVNEEDKPLVPSTAEMATLMEVAEIGDTITTEVAQNWQTDLQSNRLISYDIAKKYIRQFKITNEGNTFYSATGNGSVSSILENGLDPSYGGREVKTVSDWNSQGHVYFALDKKLCETYGDKMGYGKGEYTILTVHLPVGYSFTVDPEIPNGFRSQTLIPASNIKIGT